MPLIMCTSTHATDTLPRQPTRSRSMRNKESGPFFGRMKDTNSLGGVDNGSGGGGGGGGGSKPRIVKVGQNQQMKTNAATEALSVSGGGGSGPGSGSGSGSTSTGSGRPPKSRSLSMPTVSMVPRAGVGLVASGVQSSFASIQNRMIDRAKKRAVQKAVIGSPTDFRHEGHLGIGDLRGGITDPSILQSQLGEISRAFSVPNPSSQPLPLLPEERQRITPLTQTRRLSSTPETITPLNVSPKSKSKSKSKSKPQPQPQREPDSSETLTPTSTTTSNPTSNPPPTTSRTTADVRLEPPPPTQSRLEREILAMLPASSLIKDDDDTTNERKAAGAGGGGGAGAGGRKAPPAVTPSMMIPGPDVQRSRLPPLPAIDRSEALEKALLSDVGKDEHPFLVRDRDQPPQPPPPPTAATTGATESVAKVQGRNGNVTILPLTKKRGSIRGVSTASPSSVSQPLPRRPSSPSPTVDSASTGVDKSDANANGKANGDGNVNGLSLGSNAVAGAGAGAMRQRKPAPPITASVIRSVGPREIFATAGPGNASAPASAAASGVAGTAVGSDEGVVGSGGDEEEEEEEEEEEGGVEVGGGEGMGEDEGKESEGVSAPGGGGAGAGAGVGVGRDEHKIGSRFVSAQAKEKWNGEMEKIADVLRGA